MIGSILRNRLKMKTAEPIVLCSNQARAPIPVTSMCVLGRLTFR
jgi:hypothetical protein